MKEDTRVGQFLGNVEQGDVLRCRHIDTQSNKNILFRVEEGLLSPMKANLKWDRNHFKI